MPSIADHGACPAGCAHSAKRLWLLACLDQSGYELPARPEVIPRSLVQTTLDTYLQHFSLEKSPFSLTPDPQFLFLTPQHREALAALFFGITARKGFMVMTGAAGTGKTTLIKKLLQSLSATSGHFSVIINPALTRSELLECILMDFGVKDIPSSKALRLYLFKDMLVKANLEGKISVLVVDEAHLLGPDLIEEIRLLSNFETPEQKLLQIVLAGQKELNNILNLPSMTQVRQRVAIRMRLDPLDRGDIERYLRIRWTRAGAHHPLPFSPDAIESIARLSAGVPRLINAICDAALINAYGSGKREIRAAGIAEVATDLQLADGDFAQPIPNSPPPSSGLTDKTPESPVPAAGSVKAIERYMPPKRQQRKLFSVTNWFRFAHTEVE